MRLHLPLILAALLWAGMTSDAGAVRLNVGTGKALLASKTIRLLPTVTSVSPNTSVVAGGVAVTIAGTNFTGATAVNFGAGNPATFVFVNSTTITVASNPAHAAGTVNVTVTTPLGTSVATGANQFTYGTPPTCNGVLDLSTGCAQLMAFGGLF